MTNLTRPVSSNLTAIFKGIGASVIVHLNKYDTVRQCNQELLAIALAHIVSMKAVCTNNGNKAST